jgi:hypothetical protein
LDTCRLHAPLNGIGPVLMVVARFVPWLFRLVSKCIIRPEGAVLRAICMAGLVLLPG